MTDSDDDRRRAASDTAGSTDDGVSRVAVDEGPVADEGSDTGDAPGVDSDADTAVGADEFAARLREPIEPEDPSPENALFVFLGVLGTVGLLASAVLPGLL